MRMIVSLSLALLLLDGCVGDSRSEAGGDSDFSITSSDDRFDESDETIRFANGCRIIAKTINGYDAGYGLGVWLDPLAFTDKKTGNVNRCAFTVDNKFLHLSGVGTVDSLGYIKQMTFNADGKLIIPRKISEQTAFKSNGNVHIIHDSAVCYISKEQLYDITSANSIDILISGSNHSLTINNADILPSWRDKLRRFKAEAMEAKPIVTK